MIALHRQELAVVLAQVSLLDKVGFQFVVTQLVTLVDPLVVVATNGDAELAEDLLLAAGEPAIEQNLVIGQKAVRGHLVFYSVLESPRV